MPYWRYTQIDRYSGDITSLTYLCGVPIRRNIRESALSSEARRLGMDLPHARKWLRHSQDPNAPSSRVESFGLGEQVWEECDHLVLRLAQTGTPDEERRAILEKILTSLRTERLSDTEWRAVMMIADIDEKNRLRERTGGHVLN